MEAWLCEGAPFEDRFWHPSFVVHRKTIIAVNPATDFLGHSRPLPQQAKGEIMRQIAIENYLAADPAFPTATWQIHSWSEECLDFDTPTGQLAPGDVSQQGAMVYWFDEAGEEMQSAQLKDVVIVRDAGVITSVTRKPQ